MDASTKAQVLLGKDAEVFLESDLGKVILGMAKQDAEAAAEEFNQADITNQARLLEIKVKMRAALMLEKYLNYLIEQGKEAWETGKDT